MRRLIIILTAVLLLIARPAHADFPFPPLLGSPCQVLVEDAVDVLQESDRYSMALESGCYYEAMMLIIIEIDTRITKEYEMLWRADEFLDDAYQYERHTQLREWSRHGLGTWSHWLGIAALANLVEQGYLEAYPTEPRQTRAQEMLHAFMPFFDGLDCSAIYNPDYYYWHE